MTNSFGPHWYDAGGKFVVGGQVPMPALSPQVWDRLRQHIATVSAVASIKDQMPANRNLRGGIRLFRVWRVRDEKARTLGDFSSHHPTSTWLPGAHQVPDRWAAEVDVNDWRLGALVHRHTWTPGINTDSCEGERNPFSGRIQGGGFYGFKSYDELMCQEPNSRKAGEYRFAGTVIGYGRVEVHQHGAKVQHAVIESIIEPEEPNEGLKAVMLAQHYGCRVIAENTAKQLRGGLVPYREGQDL